MILDLYGEINQRHKSGARFIDEVFVDEIYSEAKPKLTVVDLGAFEGEFGFYCLPFSKAIFCVEPDPQPFEIMNKLIDKYGLKDIVKTFPIAISGESGKRFFHNSGGGGSSLSASLEDSIEVDSLTLNDFLVKNDIHHVDILKIDVESAEAEIFKALDIKMALDKIGLIIGEDHGYHDILKEVFESNGFYFKDNAEKRTFLAKKI